MASWTNRTPIGMISVAVASPACATIFTGKGRGGSAALTDGSFVSLVEQLANPFGPPNSVGAATSQSPNLYQFDEDQVIVLAAQLAVNDGAGQIPAGMTGANYDIFFDPGPTQSSRGTVNFNSLVLGILTAAATPRPRACAVSDLH